MEFGLEGMCPIHGVVAAIATEMLAPLVTGTARPNPSYPLPLLVGDRLVALFIYLLMDRVVRESIGKAI